jgi:glycosyltransferase involved in cell wall biosynthesis
MPEAATAMMPRVSVVIPTFNRARDLARCLDSLVAQTFRDFEVLVCDDGSTDDSGAVAKSYGSRLRLEYHWGENFGGPARPRNRGVQLARGELIAFLDSDDWWAPEKLATSVRALDAGADFVYHDLYLVFDADARRHSRKSLGRVLRRPVFDDLLGNGNAINNSSVVTRTELMRRIGGFSEDRELIAAEDYDAWVRVARHTDAFEQLPECLGYYWVGSGNISNPRRTITTSLALEARYAAELAKLREGREVYWLAYAKGRAHFVSGQFAEARREFSTIRWSRAPVSLRMRSLWMSFVMRMRGAGSAG